MNCFSETKLSVTVWGEKSSADQELVDRCMQEFEGPFFKVIFSFRGRAIPLQEGGSYCEKLCFEELQWANETLKLPPRVSYTEAFVYNLKPGGVYAQLPTNTLAPTLLVTFGESVTVLVRAAEGDSPFKMMHLRMRDRQILSVSGRGDTFTVETRHAKNRFCLALIATKN